MRLEQLGLGVNTPTLWNVATKLAALAPDRVLSLICMSVTGNLTQVTRYWSDESFRTGLALKCFIHWRMYPLLGVCRSLPFSCLAPPLPAVTTPVFATLCPVASLCHSLARGGTQALPRSWRAFKLAVKAATLGGNQSFACQQLNHDNPKTPTNCTKAFYLPPQLRYFKSSIDFVCNIFGSSEQSYDWLAVGFCYRKQHSQSGSTNIKSVHTYAARKDNGCHRTLWLPASQLCELVPPRLVKDVLLEEYVENHERVGPQPKEGLICLICYGCAT
eukprot:1160266-Pelagomonas_calceolata.AAC.13